MRMYDIIIKKRNGFKLEKEEIDFVINGYVEGRIPDYQMSALLMAIYFQKMDMEETANLTMAMVNSGDRIDLSSIKGIKVDKHSTGGVGDTTTLIVGPMVAATGVPVAKMSGRGLGHTGGTIDKLESIYGFSVEMSKEKFIENVNTINIAVAGQTANLATADKKLYSLRDVTGTVDNISLIASSIMSKKIASGADCIVLDVKTGSGAFMKTIDDSFELAKAMVDIGESLGRKTVAVISDMDQPLGFAVGNALEVKEAIEALKGNGPEDLLELCFVLGANMLVLSKICSTFEEGRGILKKTIEDGSAFKKFKEFITAQGGDLSMVENPDLLPKAHYKESVMSPLDGYISKIIATDVGRAALILGAGRETKNSIIDLSVGIVINKKVGDFVEKGDLIAIIYGNDKDKMKESHEELLKAYHISEKRVDKRPLIYGIVTGEGINKY